MKKSIIFLFILLSLISCNKSPYQEFDFSYADTEIYFSVKFTQSDTVYIRQNWTKNDLIKNSLSPSNKIDYVGILNSVQRKKLDSFLIHTDFQIFDSLYEENIMDGSIYKFYLKKKDTVKLVKIHSGKPPSQLKEFASWIINTKNNLNLIKTSKPFKIMSKDIFYKPESLK
ncbi:hypothetical protein CBW16_09155 [Flavobacteriaceae bacterium JJC]|nr:hypothetical protein CBW16_09155 [Flavobacteriaceae bacterium JJC]